jgi:DNA-3-methyladenine glycosylase
VSIDLSLHSSSVGPALLGAVVHGPNGSGRIVEVEAYGGAEDAASHACRGVTPRTEPMFGPPGVLYVYFIYGMYHCANVVTGPAGDGQAVLIRAIEPNEVTEAMRTARPTIRRDEDLTNGPGKLCAALGIDRSHDGLNLLHTDSSVRLVIDEPVAPAEIETSTRIGISVAQERPWRWYLRDNAWVSKPR